MIVANARGDAPPGCAFRDKTHGGSAGLPIEIIGAASVCGWAASRVPGWNASDRMDDLKLQLRQGRFRPAVWQGTVHTVPTPNLHLRERHDARAQRTAAHREPSAASGHCE